MDRGVAPVVHARPAIRPLMVWLGSTATGSGAVALGLPGATTTLRVLAGVGEWHRVDRAIVDLCSLALVAAAAWAWTVTTSTVLGLLRGRPTPYGGPVRRLVLLACGVALAVSATPATAGTDASTPGLHGLPYPDRPVAARTTPPAPAPGPVDRPTTPSADDTVVVAPGDSLWSIAVRTAATPETVGAHWRAIIAANPGLLDPDVVLPGQRISVPRSAGAR